MKYVRLTSGDDGSSGFDDGEIPFTVQDFAPPAPPMQVSEPEDATRLVYLILPAGWTGAQHCSPKRQVLLCLSGRLAVEAGDGSRREIRAGGIWRMEDTTGPGHVTSVIGDEDARVAIVQLE